MDIRRSIRGDRSALPSVFLCAPSDSISEISGTAAFAKLGRTLGSWHRERRSPLLARDRAAAAFGAQFLQHNLHLAKEDGSGRGVGVGEQGVRTGRDSLENFASERPSHGRERTLSWDWVASDAQHGWKKQRFLVVYPLVHMGTKWGGRMRQTAKSRSALSLRSLPLSPWPVAPSQKCQ